MMVVMRAGGGELWRCVILLLVIVVLLRVSEFIAYRTTEPAHEGAAGWVVGAVCCLDFRDAAPIVKFEEDFAHDGPNLGSPVQLHRGNWSSVNCAFAPSLAAKSKLL